MTVQELIEKLQTLTAEEKMMHVVADHAEGGAAEVDVVELWPEPNNHAFPACIWIGSSS